MCHVYDMHSQEFLDLHEVVAGEEQRVAVDLILCDPFYNI